MIGILIAFPWVAFVLAAAFFALWANRRRRSRLIAASCWAAYGGYEWLMHERILCSGECNIRIDLLLIYPFLLVVSLIAAFAGFRGIPR